MAPGELLGLVVEIAAQQHEEVANTNPNTDGKRACVSKLLDIRQDGNTLPEEERFVANEAQVRHSRLDTS